MLIKILAVSVLYSTTKSKPTGKSKEDKDVKIIGVKKGKALMSTIQLLDIEYAVVTEVGKTR